MYISKICKKFIVLVFLLVITSCQSKKVDVITENIIEKESSIVTEIEDETLIALLVPLSGKSNAIGSSLLHAAQLSLFKNDFPNISIVIVDTEADNFNIRDVLLDLKKQNVQLILGPLYYADTRDLAPIAQALDISVISFSNNSELAKHGVIVFGITPENQTESIIGYANSKINVNEYFALLPDNEYGKIIQSSMYNTLAQSDSSPIKIEFYRDDASLKQGFYRIMNDVHNFPGNQKALFYPEGGDNLRTLIPLLESTASSNQKLKILGLDNWDDQSTLNLKPLNGALLAKNKASSYSNYEKEFKNTFGYIPEFISVLAYDAVTLAINIAKSDKNFNYSAIINSEETKGANLSFHFSNDGIVHYTIPIAKIIDNEFKIITNYSPNN